MANNPFNKDVDGAKVNYIMFGAGTLRAKAYIHPPELPSPVLLTPVDEEQWVPPNDAIFKWQRVPGATSYRLVLPGGTYTPVYDSAGIHDTILRIPAGYLTGGDSYSWYVCASNDANVKSISLRRTFRANPRKTICYSPKENEIVSQPPRLCWDVNDPSEIQNYRIQLSYNRTFTNIIFDTTFLRNVWYCDPKVALTDNTTCYWRIFTTYISAYGEWSDSSCFTLQRPKVPISSPVGLIAILCLTACLGTAVLFMKRKTEC